MDIKYIINENQYNYIIHKQTIQNKKITNQVSVKSQSFKQVDRVTNINNLLDLISGNRLSDN